jgi:GcrA cell cycle regulator
MQQFGWTNEHSEALRQYLREGMSYLESSKALNAKFKTAYSRSAIIGRAKRMGLFTAEQRDDPPSSSPARCSRKELIPLREARERHVPEFVPRIPLFQAYELPKLRCVEINPRHLALVDLEAGDCRYPYGGDEEGEAITFCGHPQQDDSRYCGPHFHLTRDLTRSGGALCVEGFLRLLDA